MSGQQKESAAGTAATAPAIGSGARFHAILADLRLLPGWLRRNPVRAGGAAGILLISLGALIWLVSLVLPRGTASSATLEQALKALESGDAASARQIALAIRSNDELSYHEQGGPLYVLGIAIANDADKLWNPREKRMLHLVAAKLLQEARNHGFPEGHEAQGAFQLGKSWLVAGQPNSASEALRLALELDSPQAAEARNLLAESYLLAEPPQPARALTVNADYLLIADLPEADRQTARLREVRIYLTLGQLSKCRQSLDKIPRAGALSIDRAILDAQLLLAQGEALLASDSDPPRDTRSFFQQAAETLRSLPLDDIANQESVAAIQYLLGVCFEQLGDDDDAIAQYNRLHRQNADTPDKVAALLREANLLLVHKQFSQAVDLVVKAISDEQQAFGAHNPWMSRDEIQRRLAQMEQTLIDSGAFDEAHQLAGISPGPVPAWQLSQWRANTYEAQAAASEREAEKTPLVKAEQLRGKARADRRRAGREAAHLAEMRALEREFTDDLWRSAEQYYLGRDYPHAIEVVRKYLHNESRSRRPDALLLLAESQLALGEPNQAIETLMECLESFPNHPTAYQARIIAAQAYMEIGLLAEAKAMLAINVDSDSLSPRSAQWRDSLFLMGKLLHREGLEYEAKSRKNGIDDDNLQASRAALADLEPAHLAFTAAIDQLTKAVERYPEAPQTREARYFLADSYRQAAKWPRKRMKLVTIEATKAALARQNQLWLDNAIVEYDRIITQLGDVQDSINHTPLEKRLLRNSYFNKADALFDLGRYDDAIRAYSAASNRYQNEPEALGAYVQIAACYRLLHKLQEARGTLQQAQGVLLRMKPEAKFTAATPYTREEWSALLKWLATL